MFDQEVKDLALFLGKNAMVALVSSGSISLHLCAPFQPSGLAFLHDAYRRILDRLRPVISQTGTLGRPVLVVHGSPVFSPLVSPSQGDVERPV